jgi:hypothetical protein
VTGLVRRGGRGTLANGASLSWSVAEGRGGRRWRSATADADGTLRTVVLLETDVDGRPNRLEVATAAGLLTLHPAHDTDGLFGNVVTAGGIRHLALPWSPRHEVLVDGAPLVAVAAVLRLSNVIAVGEGSELAVVHVGAALEVEMAQWRFERLTESRWRVTGEGRVDEIAIDEDGLPDALDGGESWPLER